MPLRPVLLTSFSLNLLAHLLPLDIPKLLTFLRILFLLRLYHQLAFVPRIPNLLNNLHNALLHLLSNFDNRTFLLGVEHLKLLLLLKPLPLSLPSFLLNPRIVNLQLSSFPLLLLDSLLLDDLVLLPLKPFLPLKIVQLFPSLILFPFHLLLNLPLPNRFLLPHP